MKTKLLLLFVILFMNVLRLNAQTIKLTPYASNLGYAIDIRNCKDGRLFVADRNGLIRIVTANASTLGTPFLNITSKISSTQVEEGFLGFCFSPNYLSNGKFYVCYTTTIASELYTTVEEYRVSSDPNIADPNSARTIISAKQPFQNHKGGSIFFGGDGYLYIPLGDGGSGGDPFNNAQNNDVILGKILRIDVNNSTPSQAYAIPSSNPFYNTSGTTRKEIWANGIRNPWRSSMDRLTHDVWIADVGQGAWEEINFQPANSTGGENYGWKTVEGTHCYSPSSNCNTAGLKSPIYDYGHGVGQSITGGYVYRGVQTKALWGIYLYSDFGGRWIDGLSQNNGVLSGSVLRLLNNAGGGPISFGEDKYGELYVCLNNNATIYKIEDANPSPTPKAYFTNALTNTGYELNAFEGIGLTYQWLYNNSPIPGATSPLFQPSLNGEYKLVVTNSFGNQDISDPFILAAALPVSFTDFSAKNIRTGLIEVSWITETEQNNRGFELQRKLQDENDFRFIHFIPSQAPTGNSTGSLKYFYNDTIQYNGIIQYRLKQEDHDGKFTYSPVATVKADNEVPDVLIAPNPAKGWLRIRTTINDTYLYTINDVNGRTLLKSSFKGTDHRFSVMALERGIYYLRIQSVKTGRTVVKTVMIEKTD